MDAPGRLAFLSDVHGNATAFQAVLEDIRERGIPTIVNMGDIIGYGPDPELCIDLAMEACDICLCGNHEYAVIYDAEGFNPVARSAVEFVRERLAPRGDEQDTQRARRWQFIQSLPPTAEFGDVVAVHGSPRHPVMEYVLPSDPELDPLKLDEIFESMSHRLAFVGHTHFPGIVTEKAEVFLTTEELGGVYELENDERLIVNVGSVGQPRDRDARACYVEYDGRTIHFRRVEYDIETTVRKIQESGRLHESLGARLREGK
jgi:diadenosine tetraphosphatase ApaH/serine/threonine PP2A family protein phosphatase